MSKLLDTMIRRYNDTSEFFYVRVRLVQQQNVCVVSEVSDRVEILALYTTYKEPATPASPVPEDHAPV